MTDAPYKKIHVVINPASGKDEPILNTINDVFFINIYPPGLTRDG